MSCILVMTFSGSMMMFMYLILKYLLGSSFSASWRYKMLKVAMLYYLIPLPFLKPIYEKLFTKLFVQENEIVYTWSDDSLIINMEGQIYFNQVFRNKIVFVAIWIGVAAGIMLFRILSYLRNKKRLLAYKKHWIAKYSNVQMQELKSIYGVKRDICCYECEMEQTAFTIGVVRPIILYNDTGSDAKNQMIICHEIVHIKGLDALWKMIMTFVKIMHWYNPLVWWFSKEIEQTCEMACDEIVVRDKTEMERKEYARLLLDASMEENNISLWKVALSNDAKRVKERMKNVLQQKEKAKKGSTYISVCIVGSAILLNSLTVLAYDDMQYRVIEETENVQAWLEGDTVFVPDGMEKEENIYTDIIKYNCQFVDGEGNIYPIEEEGNSEKACSHTFVSGQVKKHNTTKNVDCSLVYYEGERCIHCSDVVMGNYIMTVEFPMCIH